LQQGPIVGDEEQRPFVAVERRAPRWRAGRGGSRARRWDRASVTVTPVAAWIDLPTPFGPTIPRRVRGPIARSTPSRMTWPPRLNPRRSALSEKSERAEAAGTGAIPEVEGGKRDAARYTSARLAAAPSRTGCRSRTRRGGAVVPPRPGSAQNPGSAKGSAGLVARIVSSSTPSSDASPS
jgi:hypothetical protein